MVMLISLLIAVIGGLTVGAVSSLITGISIPVISIILANTGIATQFPVACLIFLVASSITNQLLQTITAHKSAVLSLDAELSELRVVKPKPTNKREYVEQTLELAQSIRQTLIAKINGFRLGYIFLGMPLIILGSLLPLNTVSTVIGVFSLLSVPLLCISIAVLAFKSPKLGLFMCIGGALAWLLLNSPAMSTAPSSAPIMLIFSCALVIQSLEKRKSYNTLPMHWVEPKYTPKLQWYLGLLRPLDWLYALAGGALAGMTPGFIKALTNSEVNTKRELTIADQLNQIQVQSISEILSLFLILTGGGNSRTSLSAEVYTLLPKASPWIAIACIFLIELIIHLVIKNVHVFIKLVDRFPTNPISHILIPNLILLTIALGPFIALPGALVSAAIGLLHKQLKLPSNQFITVLSLPTLLILSPFNAHLVSLVF